MGDRKELDMGEGMSEWQECKLGQLVDQGSADLQTGPFGTMLNASEYTATGVPVIAVQDIGENKLKHNKFVYVDESTVSRLSRYKVKEGDIIFGRKGAVERRAIIKKNEEGWLQGSDCIRVRFDSSIDSTFISYQFGSQSYKEWMLQNSTGATMPSLNQQVLKLLPITLPPLLEQKAIASILSSLDDKIDLLHRQSKTLEAIAETLFRQWFIEEAQDDWEEVSLSEICSVITKGTTPTTLGHQFIDSGVNFIKAEAITDKGDFIVDKFAKISEEVHQILKRSIIQPGDILCSIAGTIGRVAIVDNSILPANTNQAIAIIRVNNEKCFSEFIYLFLKSEIFQEIMDGKIVHAVQPNLSLGEIGKSTLKLPIPRVLNEFKEMIEPIFYRKRHNVLEIHTLEKLRDNLLPKFMSGEVRVKS